MGFIVTMVFFKEKVNVSKDFIKKTNIKETLSRVPNKRGVGTLGKIKYPGGGGGDRNKRAIGNFDKIKRNDYL